MAEREPTALERNRDFAGDDVRDLSSEELAALGFVDHGFAPESNGGGEVVPVEQANALAEALRPFAEAYYEDGGGFDVPRSADFLAARQVLAAFRESDVKRDRKGQFSKQREVPASIQMAAPDLGHVRTEKVDQVLGEDNVDSLEKHTTDVNNDGVLEYTPERTELHRKIVLELLRGAMPGRVQIGAAMVEREEPEILYTAGGPASGKSSVLGGDDPPVKQPSDPAHIDQDFAKKMLPEYRELAGLDDDGNKIEGVEPDAYASDSVHREAADIAHMAVEEAKRRRMEIISEGTGDSGAGQFAERIKRSKQRGYKTRVIYANVPTPVAEERAKSRAEKEGRAVPLAGLRAMHANVARFFPEVRELVESGDLDELTLWQTEDRPPTLIFRQLAGEEPEINEELFEAFLAKAAEDDGTLIELPSFV